FATNHQRSWARNVDRVCAECVMQPVGFGHDSILIEQKDAGDGMLLQEFSWPPDAISLFGSNERQMCSRCFNLRQTRLKLSHALHAVRSPGTAHKLENQRAPGEQTSESERTLAVGRLQRKVRGARSDLQSVGAVLHIEFDFKRGGKREQ